MKILGEQFLVRGKRIDTGEFVIGDLCRKWIQTRSNNGRLVYLICTIVDDAEGNKWNIDHEVNPETIDMCTGRNDNNNNWLFMNDICVDEFDQIGIIKWDSDSCLFFLEYADGGWDYIDIPLKKICTIHENHELLEIN
jgi:hypothetical protein